MITATPTTDNSSSVNFPLPTNAITLLLEDHEKIVALFKKYEKARSISKKNSLVIKICQELSVHTQLQEEIFYPAFKDAINDKKLVSECIVEHTILKGLITQVRDKEPDGEMFDAKIKVMSEYLNLHASKKQNEMFSKVTKNKLDLILLGAQLVKRKKELINEISSYGTDG